MVHPLISNISVTLYEAEVSVDVKISEDVLKHLYSQPAANCHNYTGIRFLTFINVISNVIYGDTND